MADKPKPELSKICDFILQGILLLAIGLSILAGLPEIAGWTLVVYGGGLIFIPVGLFTLAFCVICCCDK